MRDFFFLLLSVRAQHESTILDVYDLAQITTSAGRKIHVSRASIFWKIVIVGWSCSVWIHSESSTVFDGVLFFSFSFAASLAVLLILFVIMTMKRMLE